MPVTVRVPAKVNLHLGVGALRDDGFHELVTVFQAVSLYDEVTVAAAGELKVEVSGESARAVPVDRSNLAARAVVALARRVGREPAVHVTIRKGIPVAGGMAGGSADAAAALLGCDTLWGSRVAPAVLQEVAAEIGSDVPFCLSGNTALAGGRGEKLTSVLTRGAYHWVFAFADGGLSTPAVYAQLDRMRELDSAAALTLPNDLLGALAAADARVVASSLHNDLQVAAVALRPSLRRTLEAGADAGALGGVVCGSGPTCAFLAADEASAVSLVAALSGSGTCRDVRRARGPMPGARVIP